MIEKINDILEKYEDDIMTNTLGGIYDEFGQEYSLFYDLEWASCRRELSRLVNEMLKLDLTEDALMYFIIAKFDKIISFESGQVNLKGLRVACKNIIDEVFVIGKE